MRALRVIVSLLLIAGLGFVVWRVTNHKSGEAAAAAPGEGGRGDPSKRVVPVLTSTVALKDVPITLEGLGNVLAYNTVTVKTQVDGRLDKVQFKEGQTVHKGDILAEIDPRPFLVQLHQAEGALARDTAQLHDAKVNYQRYSSLEGQKLIAAQQVDDQHALVGQLEGAIQVDNAAVESAKLNLEYAHIRSPIDGVTGVRLVDQGNIVHASDQTGIVMITQLDPITVVFSLPQDDLPRVAKQFRQGPLAVEAYNRDGETHLGTGQLGLIDNQINQATATMRLKAVFPNPERMLWPNQFVKARLLLMTRKNVIAVPSTVVQRGPQGTFAYVVDQNQTAAIRPIEVDTVAGDITIISKGLQPGDEVVVDGQSALRPGAKVAPRPMNGQRPGSSDAAAGGGKGGPTTHGKMTQREKAVGVAQ